MSAPAQITALLNNRDLDRLARLRLGAARRFTNRARGEHLAAKGGTSTEFCDFRDYSPGDDVRFVDWNVFARINRPYLKQYHLEEEMHVVLVVDASMSMTFEDKLPLAARLAAAFGAIGLRGGEKVSAYAVGGGTMASLRPSAGRSAQGKLFAFLESIKGGGEQPLEDGIESVLRRHRGRGVFVLLSDFLTAGDLKRAFNLVHHAGLEIFALQVLGPAEIAPDVTGDFRLVDSETTATLDISNAGALLALYHEYRATLEAQLATLCAQRHGRFISTSSAEPFEKLFFETLRRKGWVV
jgi:uncharacterized protein (DUF58 family)